MGIFGWSLPPGVSHRMIDEAMGVDQPCECCGKMVDDCICPECPKCGEYGNPDCYTPLDNFKAPKGHGMEYTDEQLAGQAELEEHYKAERERDDAMYEEYKKDEEYFGKKEDRKVQAESILDDDYSKAFGD